MAFIIYRQTSTDPGRVAGSVKNLPLTNIEVDGNFKVIDADLALKATTDSPTLTGTPAAPTPTTATNTTQVATTAYVVARIANDAPTKTGTNASGTWGISVTGSSASTTGNAANVTGIVAIANGGTGNATGAAVSATTATSATTAGTSTNINIINDDTAATSMYPVWVANTGNMAAKTSSSKLSFTPSTGVLNSTTFNATSDKNLKTNIVPLADALSIVTQLNGVSFDWKDGTGSSYGMIAQEVEPILPHAVSDNGVHKSINYSAVIPFLLESIKELQARIVLLENK